MSTGRLGAGDTAIQPTIFDAKGDLLTATAGDTPARLAVGESGSTLVADSSTSTGLRYNPQNALANPVINGGMDIWQRGTSISVSASSTPYTADRWQISTGANQASTVSRQATGDTTNLPNVQYAARVQRNSGQTGTGSIAFVQSFETTNSIPLAGKAVTVSFYARKGADYSASSSALGLDFISGTGTDQNRIAAGYTGNANVFSNAVTLTTSWQRFVFTGTVPATATELATYFIFTPTGTASTNDYFELTGVQIDLGTYTASSAPTFRRSGGTLAGELVACQRYYYLHVSGSNKAIGMASVYNTGEINTQHSFPVTMRVSPTLTSTSGTNYYKLYGNNTSTLFNGPWNTQQTSTTMGGMYFLASGLTAGTAGILNTENAASLIAWSAEL